MNLNRTAFLYSLVLLSVFVGFLHFNIIPHIAWRGSGGTVELGWTAVIAAWPIWITSGAAAAAVGLSGSLRLRRTVNERRAINEADKYRSLALQARKEADSAMRVAESAFEADRQALTKREEGASRLSRHAEDAIGQTQFLHARIAELQYEVDYTRKRLASIKKPRRPARRFSSDLPFK